MFVAIVEQSRKPSNKSWSRWSALLKAAVLGYKGSMKVHPTPRLEYPEKSAKSAILGNMALIRFAAVGRDKLRLPKREIGRVGWSRRLGHSGASFRLSVSDEFEQPPQESKDHEREPKSIPTFRHTNNIWSAPRRRLGQRQFSTFPSPTHLLLRHRSGAFHQCRSAFDGVW